MVVYHPRPSLVLLLTRCARTGAELTPRVAKVRHDVTVEDVTDKCSEVRVTVEVLTHGVCVGLFRDL